MSTAIVPVVHADPTELRRQRGLAIAAVTRIEQKKSGLWSVPSQKGNGHYWVRLDTDPPTCTCPDFEERSQPCKHVFAVQFTSQRESHPDGTETLTETLTVARKTTVAKKPTYKQNWPAYNKAQTTEKHRFQAILHDLCREIPEPPCKPGPGRKPLRLADSVFAAVFKVYSTISARRFMCDLEDAHARAISPRSRTSTRSPTPRNAGLTPILQGDDRPEQLAAQVGRARFRGRFIGFAPPDSSAGSTTSTASSKQKYDWVKVHLDVRGQDEHRDGRRDRRDARRRLPAVRPAVQRDPAELHRSGKSRPTRLT